MKPLKKNDNKRHGRPKSKEKYKLILKAASSLFLNDGFVNTSMDKVAKKSGVSKQTVYSHFENKDALFKSVISCKCELYQLDTNQLLQATIEQLPFKQYLTQVGGQLIRLIQDPEAVALYRVIIAEATKNPHVAKLFYDAGPEASRNSLGEVFYLYGNGLLSRHESQSLASDFCALLLGDFHTRLLCGVQGAMSESEILAHVDMVVSKINVLFRAYCQE